MSGDISNLVQHTKHLDCRAENAIENYVARISHTAALCAGLEVTLPNPFPQVIAFVTSDAEGIGLDIAQGASDQG